MAWSSASVALAVVSALGIPAYLLFGEALPIALRDRPWPIEGGAYTAAACALAIAVWRRGRREFGCAAIAIVAAGSLSLYARALRYQLPATPRELAAGGAAGDFTLSDASGQPVTLSALRGRPVLLVFYKGGWCPFCRKELARLASEARPFMAAGVQIVAISSDSQEAAARTKERFDLPFTVLADPDLHVVPRCGVSHCLVLLDDAGAVRWGAFTENWRGATPYDRVLQVAMRMRGAP